LDADQDDLISAQHIDITNIDVDVLESIGPLLCEMEETGQTLDFQQFKFGLNRLIDTLSPVERNNLLKTSDIINKRLNNHIQKENDKLKSRPNISKISQKLTSSTSINSPVYDRLYSVKDKVKYDNERKRLEKEDAELNGCTFVPVINKTYQQRSRVQDSGDNSPENKKD